MQPYKITVEILELGRIARAEFNALYALKKLKGFDISKEERRRFTRREFKNSIKSHFSLLEFGRNSHGDTVDKIGGVEVKTKALNNHAARRVGKQTSKYMKLFDQNLDGSTVDYKHKIVSRRARHSIDRHHAVEALARPNKTDLIDSFKTWIDYLLKDVYPDDDQREEQVVKVFISFHIPTAQLPKLDISKSYNPILPTTINYRTFDN